MFDMMPRTTSFLSRLSTIPMVRPICVRATITRNKELMLVCDFKGGRKRNRMLLLKVDQGVIVALGGWLKDCWVGSPKCGVGRRGGTACGGGGSNYLSKQYTQYISSERLC